MEFQIETFNETGFTLKQEVSRLARTLADQGISKILKGLELRALEMALPIASL